MKFLGAIIVQNPWCCALRNTKIRTSIDILGMSLYVVGYTRQAARARDTRSPTPRHTRHTLPPPHLPRYWRELSDETIRMNPVAPECRHRETMKCLVSPHILLYLGLIMQVIQERYIPLESRDHENSLNLSLFKTASWIKLRYAFVETIA